MPWVYVYVYVFTRTRCLPNLPIVLLPLCRFLALCSHHVVGTKTGKTHNRTLYAVYCELQIYLPFSFLPFGINQNHHQVHFLFCSLNENQTKSLCCRIPTRSGKPGNLGRIWQKSRRIDILAILWKVKENEQMMWESQRTEEKSGLERRWTWEILSGELKRQGVKVTPLAVWQAKFVKILQSSWSHSCVAFRVSLCSKI